MLKLIFKFLGLFVILIFIGELGWKATDLPYYWGNVQLNTKLEYLKEKKIDPDNYFIGSSVTFRHVIPTIFDSLSYNDIGYSFNLGCDGIFAPQTTFLLEHLMEEDTSIKHLFIELNSYDYFGQNFRTTRSKYYFNSKYLADFYQYISASSISITNKLGISGMYLYTYFEKIGGLGMRNKFLTQLQEKNTFKGDVLMGEYKDGHFALKEKKRSQKEEKELKEELQKIENDFELTYRNILSKKTGYNKVLKKQLDTFFQKAKEKNVNVIFILNPVEYVFDKPSEMVALFQALPEKNKIDLADPNKHQEFYLLENRWDRGHLNDKGAIIYSKKLAEAFNNLTK